MSPARGLVLAMIAASIAAPIVMIAAMPALDPLWDIRPVMSAGRWLGFYALLAGIALVGLSLTTIPIELVTRWARRGRVVGFAIANAAVGLLLALVFFSAGRGISPVPWVIGANVAAASLGLSIFYLATKDRLYG